ncbi:2-hydroxyglutaryl-CoA dehydratase [Bacillota bacterium]
MKLAFPRIGDSHMYGRLLFMELGVEMVVPNPNSRAGLERGAAVSPEEICLPFKMMAENLISAWEMGADTAIMPSTMGPCRLGEYGELLDVVLQGHGCDYRWILLDSPSAIGLKELSSRLKSVAEGSDCTMLRKAGILAGIYKLIKGFEKLETEARIISAYEKEQGAAKGILQKCRRDLESAGSIAGAMKIVAGHRRRLRGLPLDKAANPLKLLLTGEIYTLIDAFANHHIEENLMDSGVAFEKHISIGWWLRNTIVNPFGGIAAELGKNPYMPHRIGGYAKETIGHALEYKKQGYDGIIQVFPVGCMPEIVAKSVLEGFRKEHGLPVLSIIYDEMGGEAGYRTRIEAFIDMLRIKKEKKDVLFGDRRGIGKHGFRSN